jgi:hypothetical protein
MGASVAARQQRHPRVGRIGVAARLRHRHVGRIGAIRRIGASAGAVSRRADDDGRLR